MSEYYLDLEDEDIRKENRDLLEKVVPLLRQIREAIPKGASLSISVFEDDGFIAVSDYKMKLSYTEWENDQVAAYGVYKGGVRCTKYGMKI
jgi:hypothetical protein